MSADPADQFPVMTTMSRAARDVLAERQRQMAPPPGGEGHSAGDDDRHVNRELARGGIPYAVASLDTSPAWGPVFWWPPSIVRLKSTPSGHSPPRINHTP